MTQNVEEYAKNSKKKLMLAIAISILKCKPKNISSIDFCKIIQTNLVESSPPLEVLSLLEESDKEYSQSNTFCRKELSQILNTNHSYSQTTSLQTSQIFENIRDATFVTRDENNDKVLKSFDTIQAVNNVRKIICTLYGNNSFDGVTCNDQLLENRVLTEVTQDSGYLPSSSGSYASYKRKDSDLTQLNVLLKVLINFMINPDEKGLNTSIISYISEIFGRAIDILYDHNVYLPSFDYAVDMIDNIMDRVLNKRQINMKNFQQKCITTFFLLNKSILFIKHSIMQLTKELHDTLNQLNQIGPFQALEVTEPEGIDSKFYVFYLLEGLLRQRITNDCEENMICDSEETSTHYKETPQSTFNFMESETGLQRSKRITNKEKNKRENDERILKEKYTTLLNRAVLECVETYPLISFWAMSCLSLEK